MDDSDFADLDGKLQTEREWLSSSLRWIADRVDALSLEDLIEPLTVLADEAEVLVKHAQFVLRVSLGSQRARPR